MGPQEVCRTFPDVRDGQSRHKWSSRVQLSMSDKNHLLVVCISTDMLNYSQIMMLRYITDYRFV